MTEIVNHVIVKGALLEELYGVLDGLKKESGIRIPSFQTRKDKAIVCALIYLLEKSPDDYNSYVESKNLHDANS